MNILALDYGTKNIGLARANTEVSVVLPFGVVDNKDTAAAIKKLTNIITEERIDKIIVGLPLGLDGSENKNTARVKEFIGELKKETAVSVDFMTEIFSSQFGDRMGGSVSRDEKSAMVILQSFLDKKII